MRATPSTSVDEINEDLKGFSSLVELGLTSEQSLGKYDLKIILANDEGRTLLLHCKDVSSLRLSEFGGGLTQILALRCEDVRAQQHDRVTIHFADLERDTLNFNCLSAIVLPTG
jgi:hypothetical protein